ncbi:MAG: hypothetical protein A3F11_04700 [Gammaproteobacteria bacterium RIFCSPHIGHO2_12_FULL_37_14]|nr:MAG: hypothetical protein A3F11_04700 [Gammaproteobacteria bacterium RIFCSPHIGHO2_12_FULL_37_14]
MNSVFAFILVMLITSVFVVIYYSVRRYLTLKQRVDKMASTYITNISEEEAIQKQEDFRKHFLSSVIRTLHRFRIVSYDTTKTHAKKLANAGWISKNSLVIFVSIQLLVFFVAFLWALILVMFVPWFATKSFVFKGIVVIVLMWIGYRLPEIYLSKATNRYRRKLRRSFLDFLDLFLICVEAGFSNDKALARVCKELKQLHPEFMEQVNLLITELRILPQRKVAWENFAERTGIEETKVIAQIINQSEQLGSSISQTLRAQADMFRGEKLSFIEQKAMRLPTLLTLPLVVFILPALLIILLGPTILSIIDTFRGLKQ